MAINYCGVACGRYDGVISLSKDSFPEFAGDLIIQEAGGRFTNIEGEDNIKPTDRIFIGGNKKCYDELFPLVKQVLDNKIIMSENISSESSTERVGDGNDDTLENQSLDDIYGPNLGI
jgi:hypothetical protein